MLSRIAESLFWIGRYLERADGTSRILDVYLQLLLEDPWMEESEACGSLLTILGNPHQSGTVITRQNVIDMLAVDAEQPGSIAFSLRAARENARRAREIVSAELWECLNTTAALLPKSVSPSKVHDFFNWTRHRTALAVGINESAMNRDEAWYFFTLGHCLERADMTARLLATRSLAEAGGASWTTILRACGAYEAYLRAHRGTPARDHAAEFLLLNRLFPRSIMFSVAKALDCVRALDGAEESSSYQARMALGQVISNLEYTPVEQLISDLPENMEKVQIATNSTSVAIAQKYFPSQVLPTWTGDKS